MTPIPGVTSTTAAARLSTALRALRLERGYTTKDVAQALGWSPSRLSRLETGARMRKPRVEIIARLLDFYEVPSPRRKELLALIEAIRGRDWWHSQRDALGSTFQAYLGCETWAETARGFEPGIIPRIMQTPEYARAALARYQPPLPCDVIDARVHVGMARQQRLTPAPDAIGRPLETWVILGEAALHRNVGGVTTMLAQLERLLELGSLPNVTLQVLPFAAGAYPATSPFVLLSFVDDIDPETAYVESTAGPLLIDDPKQVATVRACFESLVALALSHEESLRMIYQATEMWRRQETPDPSWDRGHGPPLAAATGWGTPGQVAPPPSASC